MVHASFFIIGKYIYNLATIRGSSLIRMDQIKDPSCRLKPVKGRKCTSSLESRPFIVGSRVPVFPRTHQASSCAYDFWVVGGLACKPTNRSYTWHKPQTSIIVQKKHGYRGKKHRMKTKIGPFSVFHDLRSNPVVDLAIIKPPKPWSNWKICARQMGSSSPRDRGEYLKNIWVATT